MRAFATYEVTRLRGTQARPDLDACVSSGLFDLCVQMVAAFAAAGVDGLQGTEHSVMYALCFCRNAAAIQAASRRSVAWRLPTFCLEHSLETWKRSATRPGQGCQGVLCCVRQG